MDAWIVIDGEAGKAFFYYYKEEAEEKRRKLLRKYLRQFEDTAYVLIVSVFI